MPAGDVVSADTTKTPAKRSASARAGVPSTVQTTENTLAMLILIQRTLSESKIAGSSTAC